MSNIIRDIKVGARRALWLYFALFAAIFTGPWKVAREFLNDADRHADPRSGLTEHVRK